MRGLIEIDIDTHSAYAVLERLESQTQCRQAIKKALNLTAKQARERLAEQSRRRYEIKKVDFRKEMKIKNATVSNLSASILVRGTPNDLLDFKVRPSSIPKVGKRPNIVKGKVLKRNSMKPLQTPSQGLKAFVIRFSNGHKSVAQRTSKVRMPIKTLLAPSVPVMLGQTFGNVGNIYRAVGMYIQEDLENNLKQFIDQIAGGIS